MSELISPEQFLNDLKKVDYVKYKDIKLDYSAIIEQCELAQQNFSECWSSLVYDHTEPDIWDDAGAELFKKQQKDKEYGYTEHSTRVWKNIFKNPKLEFEWERDIIKELPFSQATSAVVLQPPGVVMPWHQDSYMYFKRIVSPELSNRLVRFLLFLKDWEMGQLLQIGNSMLTHWKAGEVAVWHPTVYHVAANVGFTNKWTCNITGVLTDSVPKPIG